MKKLVMFALLLLAFVATAANAQCSQVLPAHRPIFDRLYACAYAQGAWTNEATNGGWSIFTGERPIRPDLSYGTEVYRATIPQGQDNRHIAFAKAWNLPAPGDTYCANGPARTRWEFTITDGVQCTNTLVSNSGSVIVFQGCSNGKTRVCVF
jgi:hypothetical protein